LIRKFGLSFVDVISRDTETCFFCNGSNSIGISSSFELLLKAGVDFGFFEEGFDLLF
jgi:hypothetical protein